MDDCPLPTCSLAEVGARHGKLDAGEKSGEEVCVAGQLMLKRLQGTVAFGTLRDRSEMLQLCAGAGWTEDFSGFCHLPLGRIAIEGEVVKTREGQLSVKVARWQLIAGGST